MGLTASIAAALVAKLAAVTGMVGAASGTETIPDTPWAHVGPARSGEYSPGAFEKEVVEFPVIVFVGRVVSQADSLTAAYDIKDATVAALRSGITLGLAGSGVAQSVLTEWSTDNYFDLGGETYQGLEMTIAVTIARGMAGSWSS